MHENTLSREYCGDLLKTLVRMDTCQPNPGEERMVKLLAGLFPETAEKKIIRHGEGRASLIVRLPGEARGGVAFVGHMDTVACGDETAWKYPPLEAKEENGVIWGRGTADMKGGLVSMIAACRHLLESGAKLKKDIVLCFTADEEVGGLGALAVAEEETLHQAETVIVAEPSNENIGICEKGALWLKISAVGALAHGSRPEIGVNGVEKLMEFERRFRKIVPVSEEHVFLNHTTMAVTKLNGGIMTNVIPANAVMEIDMRTLPSVSHDKLLTQAGDICAEMMEECPKLSLKVEIINNRPAVEVAADHPFVEEMKAACEKAAITPVVKGLYFYTDASQIIPKTKAPFVIFGPGEDTMAHQFNEHIEIDSMVRVAKAYVEYMKTAGIAE